MVQRVVRVGVWALFAVWLLLQLPVFAQLAGRGIQPIDFLAYRRAADALQRGQSPYPQVAEARQIWRTFHGDEASLLAAGSPTERRRLRQAIDTRPQLPGPYLYPPTLAALVAWLGLSGTLFGGLTLLAIGGFAWLWLRASGAQPAWLLLVVGSLDVLTSLYGGNVELALLCASLLAAWLLWRGRGLLAAPLVALVVLIKPFYALLFVAFGLLWLASCPERRPAALSALALAAAGALALIAAEVLRWGVPLRGQTVDYLAHALEYQWFVLPIHEQTPMSIWNRTPMQALVNAGVVAPAAQWLSLALWALLLGLTARAVWRRGMGFPATFALAFLLLYLGRPVGWGLIYLELVVLSTAWPALRAWQRPALLAAAIALMASHWWALVPTARGEGMPLLTLQTAALPWETWLVLPLSWLLLLRVSPILSYNCGGQRRQHGREHAPR